LPAPRPDVPALGEGAPLPLPRSPGAVARFAAPPFRWLLLLLLLPLLLLLLLLLLMLLLLLLSLLKPPPPPRPPELPLLKPLLS
jgi:hypothetical protein